VIRKLPAIQVTEKEDITMINGKMIAMAVSGLLLASSPQLAMAGGAAKEAKVKCEGINECKGKSSCVTAGNACAGMNSCKGKGVIEVTSKECKAKKGKVVAEKPADKPAK
jgi:hypothetical protein